MLKPDFLSILLIASCFWGMLCSNSSNSMVMPPATNGNPVSLEPDNPKIQRLVQHVEADSLRSFTQTLVGFGTRHTNSDTVSKTRGIGAARRWVYKKFRSFSDKNGGRLQVRYHDFQATVAGVSGLHRNVIAELPGTTTPERKFVVSGHLDSRNEDNGDAINFAAGANDDGSGVAAIMELARIFSQFEFESTVMFVAFTGEEQGLFGSRAYAQDLRQKNENIVAMVTNDVVGNIVGGSGNIDSLSVRCFSDEPSDSPNRQLARYIKIQGDAYLSDFTVNLILSRDRPGRGGDHFSFNEQGYTAARLTEPEDNLQHQHNMDDLPDFMSFPYLAKVVRVNVAYLSSWADAPESPTNTQITRLGEGQQRITWVRPDNADVVDYLLAFREPTSTTYDSLLSVGNVTEFIFTLPNNSFNGVFVSVSAVDEDGNESIFSQSVLIE